MPGHVYILKNRHIPKLVKIGFTERDPATRAAELSGNTGVPGNFEIVFAWLVADAADTEKRIHLALKNYRRTGEFFELNPEQAREMVASALKQWGVIGIDGLSFEERMVKEQEQTKAHEQQRIMRQKQDVVDFDGVLSSIVDELELRERHEGAKAHASTESKGFFSVFRSSDTPARKAVIQSAVEKARKSLASDLSLPWLFSVPSRSFVLTDDAYFIIGDGKVSRSTGEIHRRYTNPFSANRTEVQWKLGVVGSRRLPKGTSVETATGWVWIGRRLVNSLTGEILDNAKQFSAKSPISYSLKSHEGRHFSDEPNLGAYHFETLRFFVGEIAVKKV